LSSSARENSIREAALILSRRESVAFTGAGVSTASGIPDYRGPNGVWKVFDPKDFTIDVFLSDPNYYWRKRIERKRVFKMDPLTAIPNPAHHALTELQRTGILNEIITQNTDGLHQKAGSQDVIELHGNASNCICLKCSKKYPTSACECFTEKSGTAPLCGDCHYPLKPDVVLFGESLDRNKLDASFRAASRCKSIMVIGTSALVYPAASVPRIAKREGAKLIEMNQEETELTNSISDVSLIGDSSELLPKIVELIRKEPNSNY
jgi:NAD-dependent deacetylase